MRMKTNKKRRITSGTERRKIMTRRGRGRQVRRRRREGWRSNVRRGRRR
jgi:hypothetical protein